MRFFIDTNIIISSALFPKGKTSQVFSYLLEFHEIIICDYSIEECKKVFLRKFPDKIHALEVFLEANKFTIFETPKYIDQEFFPKIRDLHDLPILASAILSDVDILITGDKDFYDIAIKKPLIFSPAQYYELIFK